MAKLIMEDGEERTEGIFYSTIAYEKLGQKPEFCTRLISRPIVFLVTSRPAAIKLKTTSCNSGDCP